MITESETHSIPPAPPADTMKHRHHALATAIANLLMRDWLARQKKCTQLASVKKSTKNPANQL